jgi:GTP-binding protein HflX
MKRVKDELAKLTKNRELQLAQRKRAGLRTISIVGYTNAGKSSLFKLLTGKESYIENELFATLDSSVSKIYLPKLQDEVLLSDTIGFIRDLPPMLISAFKSTLMESIHADLLLHVIDISDPEIQTKIEVVTKILRDLQISSPVIYVFNKIDAIDGSDTEALQEKYNEFHPVFISVKKEEGIDLLKDTLQQVMLSQHE